MSEEMTRADALRVAMDELTNAIDEIEQMPEMDRKYLKNDKDVLSDAYNVLWELRKEMNEA